MAPKSTNASVKRFDLEIWIPTAIIGLANFSGNSSIQGAVSIVAPFAGHYIAQAIEDRNIRKKRDKFNGLLEADISKTKQELLAASGQRKTQLTKYLAELEEMLSESKKDMLEFERPPAKKK